MSESREQGESSALDELGKVNDIMAIRDVLINSFGQS